MDILDIAEMERMYILFANMIAPMQKKYLSRVYSDMEPWFTTPSKPINYNSMIQDIEFYGVCTEMVYRQSRSIQLYQAFNVKAEILIEQIDSEIELLK